MKNIKKILLSLMVTVTMMLSLATTSVFAASGGVALEGVENLPNMKTGQKYGTTNPYTIAKYTIAGTEMEESVVTEIDGTLPAGLQLKMYNEKCNLEGTPTKEGTYKFSVVRKNKDPNNQTNLKEIERVECSIIVEKGVSAVKAAFTSGANATWNKGSTKSVTFKVNTTMDDVVAFKVDGKALDLKYIELDDKTGSLIITMKPAYLQGISVGKHKLEVVYTDTVVATNFTVKAGGPKTSDTTNAVYVMGMLGISALAVYFVRKKKEN